ncbi:MAG: SpoIIE family protein phosphatase [Deltaproteobacteria bacterium]|nr:SpoIIE family protein phosphatase [Deltaproteobacteria bacterium]
MMVPADVPATIANRRVPSGRMFQHILVGATVVATLWLAALCAYRAVESVGKPFGGFVVNRRLFVNAYGRSHWCGIREGLKFPDRIVKAEGTLLNCPEDLDEILNRLPAGSPVQYQVEKNGGIVEMVIPSMTFTWADLLMVYGPSVLSGIAYLFIGCLVYIMKPRHDVSWAFLSACVFLCLSTVTGYECRQLSIVRLNLFAQSFIPAAGLHLALLFPARRRCIQRYPVMQFAPYAASTLLALPVLFLYPRPVITTLFSMVRFYDVATALIMVFFNLRAFLGGESALEKQRAKVVLLGAAAAFPLPAFGLLFLHLGMGAKGNIIQTNLLDIPIILFPASVAYAIARHNLFDVDVYVKRAVGYAIMSLMIGVSFYGVEVLTQSVVVRPILGGYAQVLFPIIFPLIIVFLFQPVYRRVQKLIDRLFYRLEYDYQETVASITESMRALLSVDQIVATIVNTGVRTMFIESMCVMLRNRHSGHYECHRAQEGTGLDVPEGHDHLPRGRGATRAAGMRMPEAQAVGLAIVASRKSRNRNEGGLIGTNPQAGNPVVPVMSLDEGSPLIRDMAERQSELTIYDILEDPFYEARREAYLDTFVSLRAVLMIPLISGDRLVGVMAVGNKKSGKFYRREDVNLLAILAGHGAMAIENALLLDEVIEKERMEEELAIARELQTSMLPAVCPEAKGFEIAATSIPAREVGGDFFDFIEMTEDRLGMLIGDVTGKSVSGALIMSASRSVFRMLSEDQRTVDRIMSRANRRLKKDVKSGMFVALLYAVIDSRDRILRLCSAGQTQPVHFSAKNGVASFIETLGDTFPLGILEDADYQETRLQLALGDRVVFYTDGIVEAMNPRQEIYGFERLIETIQEAGSMSADEMLREIMASVNTFVASAAQHDDLTMIVLSVTG